MVKKSNQGLTVKKNDNFSKWYSEIIEKAEIIDSRIGIKGFMVFRPWGAQIIENMTQFYEKELQKKGHKPTIMPSVIPESNLKKESSHIKGFTPEVFWLEAEKNEERLALRPTSETLYTPMFKLWIRSHRDLPLKLYQKGSVFRLDTKATRPLIRTREILWIEAHNAFASREGAEKQVKEDIGITEKIMHQGLGIPFIAIKRPSWDKFAGAEYTVGADVLMPDGKLIQQPSTHLMGQKFSKAFDAKFKDEDGKEKFLWTTAYGPAMSRIIVSVITMHGDERGLVLPFSITPLNAIIIPIYNKKNKKKILKESQKIKLKLESLGLKTDVDDSEKRPGEKYHEWELKGVPFRLEIGEKELKKNIITLFERDTWKKSPLKLKDLSKLKILGENYDKRLLKKADNMMKGKIIKAKNKQELKKILDDKKIAKISFCSTEKEGIKCAEHIEKDFKAEVRGTLADKKEKSSGKCLICNKTSKEITYIGRGY